MARGYHGGLRAAARAPEREVSPAGICIRIGVRIGIGIVRRTENVLLAQSSVTFPQSQVYPLTLIRLSLPVLSLLLVALVSGLHSSPILY